VADERPASFFSTLQRFSYLPTSKRCFPTPATIIFPFRSMPALALDSTLTEKQQ
jgi:hypothetical protein